MLSIFLLSCVVVWWYQSAKLERQFTEMRAAGYPVTLEELDEYYALPEGVEDNTALWLEALRLVEATSSDVDVDSLPIVGYVEEIPPVGEPWPEKELVEEYLGDNAEALEALYAAAAAGGGVRFPHNFQEDFWGINLPTSWMRQCGRLMWLDAHFHAHIGDIAGTAEALRAAFSVGKTLERDPVIVSFLVRVVLDAIAIEETTKLMYQIQFSDSELTSFQSELRSANYGADLHCSMVGDRTATMHAYNDLEWCGFDPLPAKILNLAIPVVKVRHAELTDNLVEATKLPLHEALATINRKGEWVPGELSMIDYIVNQGYGSQEICIEVGARAVARASTLDAAIAAELYRREHGSFPNTIDELVPTYLPEMPLDPYDGQPMRYLVDDAGIVAYSIGRNYADDGGIFERKDEQGNSDYVNVDIGVRLNTVEVVDQASPEE